MPRSPRNPATLRTTSSKPGSACNVLSAARSAGCSQARDEIWARITRSVIDSSGKPERVERPYGPAQSKVSRAGSQTCERGLEVGQQVGHILDATREANDPIGD